MDEETPAPPVAKEWKGSDKEINEAAALAKEQVEEWAKKNNYKFGESEEERIAKAQIARKKKHISNVHRIHLAVCFGLYAFFTWDVDPERYTHPTTRKLASWFCRVRRVPAVTLKSRQNLLALALFSTMALNHYGTSGVAKMELEKLGALQTPFGQEYRMAIQRVAPRSPFNVNNKRGFETNEESNLWGEEQSHTTEELTEDEKM